MCGINCIFDPTHQVPDKLNQVDRMNGQMIYRGPDDAGTYGDDLVALGMRRLSIIDVGGGHQPLFNEDHSVVLVCNGEIYNYVELMRDLKARGHRFMSGSDTETILHLYEEQGETCLQSLRGMFAFVLWDAKRRRLFAARDRIGIKPLYFSQHDGALWLSSELKAIVSVSGLAPSLRPEAVLQFLTYGYATDQVNTVIEEIKRIRPGEYMSADNSGVTFSRYWAPRLGGDEGIADHSDEEVLETLRTAVNLHLRSDVPIGILLSGGVDSSTVASFSAQSGENFTALCAGYSGKSDRDERNQAHATARYLGIDYHDVELNPGEFASSFEEITGYLDEPNGDISVMPQWALYRRARARGFKVLLSGIGGDEIFAGYSSWNSIGKLDSHHSSTDVLACQTEMLADKEMLDHIAGQKLIAAREQADTPTQRLTAQVPAGHDTVNAVLLGTYLVSNGCFLADKLGMGCSVEVRVPFLDHILVEHLLSLPLARRFDSGRSKVLLKQLMRGRLPDAVLDGRKRGFSPPEKHIVRLIEKHSQRIVDGILQKEWVQRGTIENLVRQYNAFPWLGSHRARQCLDVTRSHGVLYRMLVFEMWYANIVHV